MFRFCTSLLDFFDGAPRALKLKGSVTISSTSISRFGTAFFLYNLDLHQYPNMAITAYLNTRFPVFTRMEGVMSDMKKLCCGTDGKPDIEKMIGFMEQHNRASKLDAIGWALFRTHQLSLSLQVSQY